MFPLISCNETTSPPWLLGGNCCSSSEIIAVLHNLLFGSLHPLNNGTPSGSKNNNIILGVLYCAVCITKLTYSHQVVGKGWHHMFLDWHVPSKLQPGQLKSCTGNMWLPCSRPYTSWESPCVHTVDWHPIEEHTTSTSIDYCSVEVCTSTGGERDSIFVLPATQTHQILSIRLCCCLSRKNILQGCL